MTSFRAFRVEKTADGRFLRGIVERDAADLPAGDLRPTGRQGETAPPNPLSAGPAGTVQ